MTDGRYLTVDEPNRENALKELYLATNASGFLLRFVCGSLTLRIPSLSTKAHNDARPMTIEARTRNVSSIPAV